MKSNDRAAAMSNVFICPICGLHYRQELIKQQCEDFCREHNACGLEIIKHSIEQESK
ncbi:MAG: hypothetical protein WEC83_02040 [Patescibacteria group bacterium]